MKNELKSLKLIHRGKVGDVYAIPDKLLLLVRTDRVSGLNVKLLTQMPGKGEVLTGLSNWWMSGPLKGVVANHLTGIPLSAFLHGGEIDEVSGRGQIVKRLDPILVEAVVRRHLTGSGYEVYCKTGEVCGITLPPGLKDGDRLTQAIFTPTLKSDTDPPITFEGMCALVGTDLARSIRDVSLKIFAIAEARLLARGIILADSKFEFGLDDHGTLTLMDEVLTPDSSRFWIKESYDQGKGIVSLDKQKIRDWMKAQKDAGLWDGKTPMEIPDDLVAEVSQDYLDIFHRITEDPVVGVVMGSKSDWPTMEGSVDILKQFGVPYEKLVVSAHRTPNLLFEYADNAKPRGLKVIIAGAGGAAHLPGMLAAKTTVPILGVPVKSNALSGLDSLYSIVQMPKGIPVATFAIGEAGAVNAALFAVAMLANWDPVLAGKLSRYRTDLTHQVLAMKLPD